MSDANEREHLRRLAALDQAKAGVNDLGELVGRFYAELRRQRVPRITAGMLSRRFLERLTGVDGTA